MQTRLANEFTLFLNIPLFSYFSIFVSYYIYGITKVLLEELCVVDHQRAGNIFSVICYKK